MRSSLAALILLLGGLASAQPDPQALEEAKKRYAEGEKRFAAGDLPGAAEAFKEAYRLTRNPILLYNLGFVYDRAGDATLAIHYYEKFLADAPVAPRLNDKRAEAAARLAALVAGGEPATEPTAPEPPPPEPPPKPLEIVHEVVAEAPPAKPIDITARAPDGAPWTLELHYRNGSEEVYQAVPMRQRLAELVARIPSAATRSRTVHYYIEAHAADGKLVASTGKANAPNVIYIDPAAPAHYYLDETSTTMAPPPAPLATPIAPPPQRDRGLSALTVGKWAATGGALALIGTGIGFYVAASSHARTLEEEAFLSRTECDNPPCRVFTDTRKDLEEAGKRYQMWGHVAVAVGGAALVGAVALWVLDLRAPREPTVAPLVGPGVVGAAATIRF